MNANHNMIPPDTDTPFISVVVPVYNAAVYLRETLESIARQRYTHFEVIVVDDGSSDNSAEVAEDFCKGDARFTLIRKPNEGVGPTRNRAIATARGNWIALCDADDVWYEAKLERQVAFLQDNTSSLPEPIVALGTFGYRINAAGEVIDAFSYRSRTVQEYLEQRSVHAPINMKNSSVLFRKDIFNLVGGYRQDYHPTEDTDLWTRMAPHGIILNLSDRLVAYRMHGHSALDKGLIRQNINLERIAENTKRRAQGQPELSYDSFLELIKSDTLAYKASMHTWQLNALYRNAGSAIVNRRYLMGGWFILRAFMFSPISTLSRLARNLSAIRWRANLPWLGKQHRT